MNRTEIYIGVSGRMSLYVSVALSLYAAMLHFMAAPEHFEEWIGYGVFMLVAAFAQAVYAPLLLRLTRTRWNRGIVLLGILGNAAIVMLYIITRTVGIPAGPSAGEVEAVGDMGWIDITATLSEILLVAMLVYYWLSNPGQKRFKNLDR